MVLSRDFLDGDVQSGQGTAIGSTPAGLVLLLAEQNDMIHDIRNFLYQQNPDVVCQTVIQNAAQDNVTITDTVQHEVYFQVGGKPVTAYNILLTSTYTQTVYIRTKSFGSSALDGIPFVAGDVLILAMPIENLYIWVPTLAASNALHVNGNAHADYGGFTIEARTISNYKPNRTQY